MYTRLTTSSRAERLPPACCDSLVDYLNDLLEGGRGGGTFFPLVEVTYWNDANQYLDRRRRWAGCSYHCVLESVSL